MPDARTPDDPFGDLAPARDPLDDHLQLDHEGVAALRAATDLLDAGEASRAVEAILVARRIGVPAELAPYLAVVDATTAILVGEPARAVVVAGDAWREHPDHAALPALLGAARAMSGEDGDAIKSLFAALLSEDRDRSLAIHQRRLTMLLEQVRGAAGR